MKRICAKGVRKGSRMILIMISTIAYSLADKIMLREWLS
jgi:hypothetical protein